MTEFTEPIYDIITNTVARGVPAITYKQMAEQLAGAHGLTLPPIGLGVQLGALAALLDRVSERSGRVIPPLTSIVVNQDGEPSYGVAPVFALWMRRRPNTPPATLHGLERLPYGDDPPAFVVRLAQSETRAFDWSVVPPLVLKNEWAAAPPWRAGDHAPV